MTRTFTAVIHKEDDWYVADCPEVGTVSQGKTVSTFAAIPFLIILACTLTTISPVDTSQPPVGATETVEVPSLPRWMGYEQTLSAVLLAGTGEEGFCEWDILGHTDTDVYVWALCQVRSSGDGAASMSPAVIYLSADGRIDRVAMPRESSYLDDIKSLFPSDLQACAMDNACFDGPAAM